MADDSHAHPDIRRASRRVDTAMWALAEVARLHRMRLNPAAASHELGLESRRAVAGDIVRAARAAGLKAKVVYELRALGPHR